MASFYGNTPMLPPLHTAREKEQIQTCKKYLSSNHISILYCPELGSNSFEFTRGLGI
ncbi:38103_t:CDS:2 [Gigaspora margarita]|uniref:38103_t:CDS:1 n=1 Tax=Gigaspora margarita TaxID=4874 RepID=A0ABM8VYF3_GIGMA|nr:38103_t:CDS:2 [Gigaspora margarita]